jgi:hypothetical protein
MPYKSMLGSAYEAADVGAELRAQAHPHPMLKSLSLDAMRG